MPKLYFCLGGQSSADAGIRQLQPLRYSAPKPVYEQIDIPGRNGPLLVHTGAYEAVTASTECCIMRRPDAHLAFAEANRFLFSGLGYRRLEDALQPGFYRLASVTVGAEYYREAPNYAPFTLEFLCKPQRFLTSGESAVTLSAAGTLSNPTGFSALPLITVYGSGESTLTVNGVTVNFKTLDGSCTLDCDAGNASKDGSNENGNIEAADDFPALAPGGNAISWSGGITSVKIIPRWWTL